MNHSIMMLEYTHKGYLPKYRNKINYYVNTHFKEKGK